MTRHGTMAAMVVLVVVGSMLWRGDDTAQAELQTTGEHSDRFQLVQSARQTLRIDRFTGDTFELSERAGRQFWKKITWQDPPAAGQINLNRVNYQMATQGPRGQTFLWDLARGRTWYLATDKADIRWQIVDEE